VGRYVRLIAVAVLVFVSMPTLIVLVASFSADRVLKFPPSGVSMKPYAEMLSDESIRGALFRSLIVGTESVVLSVLVGVIAALGLFRYSVRFRPIIVGFVTLGFSAPLVVSGVAFLVLFIRFGIYGSLWSTAVAVTIVNLPFMLFAVAASVVNLPTELEDAAATLGADPAETLLFVVMPGLMPGILTGSILMFIFGITEFLVSVILSTVYNQTLPVIMFGSLRGAVSPMLAAAGGVYIAVAFALVFAMSRLRFLESFLYRAE
jgi:putative spermidine/putrescine transport system permease protein